MQPRAEQTNPLDRPVYAEVSHDSVHVLHGESAQKYLGRHISVEFEIRWWRGMTASHGKAWAEIYKHRTFLTNKHVSSNLRLKFVDAIVTPTMLFSLHTPGIRSVGLEPFPLSLWTKQLAKRQFQVTAKVAAEQSWASTAGLLDSGLRQIGGNSILILSPLANVDVHLSNGMTSCQSLQSSIFHYYIWLTAAKMPSWQNARQHFVSRIVDSGKRYFSPLLIRGRPFTKWEKRQKNIPQFWPWHRGI